jgi:hypothetical protein
MGMWEIYCAICGGPFAEEPTESTDGKPRKFSDEKWLQKVKVKNKKGVYKYDMYGGFYDKKGKIVLQVHERKTDCIHEECWKLNGESFDHVEYSSGDLSLREYQEGQWFNWESLRKKGKDWTIKDPSTKGKNHRRIKKLIQWLGMISRRYLIMYYVQRNDDDEPQAPIWFLITNTDLPIKAARSLDTYFQSDEYNGVIDNNTKLDDTQTAICELMNTGLSRFRLKGPVKKAEFNRLMEVKYFS